MSKVGLSTFTICERSADVHPEPDPTSIILSPLLGSKSSSIKATVKGWEIVWPSPMGRAESSYARSLSSSGRKFFLSTFKKASFIRGDFKTPLLQVFLQALPYYI